MIYDNAERIIRYVELDSTGVPFHSNTHAGSPTNSDGSPASEEEFFAHLQGLSTSRGQSLIRLCNHGEHNAPHPDDIESDGNGGVRAKPEYPDALNEVEFWHPSMERAFVVITDERGDEPVQRVARFEPDQWTEDLKEADLVILKGTSKIVVRPSPDA